MSNAISTSLWSRLRNTPLRDLLRGRASGVLDWRVKLAASELPASTQQLIARVVQKSRLLRGEKLDVTRELISHFLDGRKGGAAVLEMERTFGDPVVAAKLIRRAKIRGRGIVSHAARWFRRGVAVIVLLYVGVGIYYYSGRPSITVDYVSSLNTKVLASNPADRAWPLYVAVFKVFDTDRTFPKAFVPEEEGWDETLAWYAAHPTITATIREAAAKPELGFIAGPQGNARDLVPGAYQQQPLADVTTFETMLIPHLNYMRNAANTLRIEAGIARRRGDGATVAANTWALIGMSQQLHQRDLLVSDLVATGILAVAYEQIEETLLHTPELLDRETLQAFARELSKPKVPADMISLENERLYFYDFVQNAYTNDGHGNGRLTPNGLKLLKRNATLARSRLYLQKSPAWQSNLGDVGDGVIAPSVIVIGASRKDVLSAYDTLLDYTIAQSKLRFLNATPTVQPPLAIELQQSSWMQMRYSVIATMIPHLNRAVETGERALCQRDGLVVAIALELYRRDHGSYPATLDTLVPTLLPEIPRDPIAGGPLRYTLVNAKPLLYSVGVDRDDDGGRIPLNPAGQPDPYRATSWGPNDKNVDGDWVLSPGMR